MPKRNPFKLKPYQAMIIKNYIEKLDGILIGVAEKVVQRENGIYHSVVENVNVVKKEIYEGVLIYKVVITHTYVGEGKINSVIKREIECYDPREARVVFNKLLKAF
ncbi:hypothetical protein [Bacillus manliponensis]|uniref:hypothetical protein n=1 Tax=Bacillus manliponensis TaxID=574376 RepID=UPI003512ABF2